MPRIKVPQIASLLRNDEVTTLVTSGLGQAIVLWQVIQTVFDAFCVNDNTVWIFMNPNYNVLGQVNGKLVILSSHVMHGKTQQIKITRKRKS